MAATDLALFDALKTRMGWLQRRQSVLSENVANADTPGFRARELAPLEAAGPGETAGGVGVVRTHPAHLGVGRGGDQHDARKADSFAVRPSGNSVVLEEEMMKVAETQLDYRMTSGLYSRGLSLLRTALGRQA